jgi:hypothetical protein
MSVHNRLLWVFTTVAAFHISDLLRRQWCASCDVFRVLLPARILTGLLANNWQLLRKYKSHVRDSLTVRLSHLTRCAAPALTVSHKHSLIIYKPGMFSSFPAVPVLLLCLYFYWVYAAVVYRGVFRVFSYGYAVSAVVCSSYLCRGNPNWCHKPLLGDWQPGEMRDLRLPPRLKWIFRSFGLLRGVRWFDTDVSGLPSGPIFKVQTTNR